MSAPSAGLLLATIAGWVAQEKAAIVRVGIMGAIGKNLTK
jgi:hypothetical protein